MKPERRIATRDNFVHIKGKVCSTPTDRDFVVNVGEDYIHCTCNENMPHVGEDVVVEGYLRSRLRKLYGRNVVMFDVERG